MLPSIRMKILTTISILFITFFAIGQTEINQKTDYGQKTGKWIEFYENGRINKILYYKPVERKLSKEEAFMNGVQDSILYYEELKWTEEYEYQDDWKLKRVKRIEASQKPFYLYGANKEVKLQLSDFYLIERVNDTISVSVELTNNTNQIISFEPEISSSNITIDSLKFELNSKRSSTFTFKITIEPYENNYVLFLKSDSIVIDFTLQTFGYHIDSYDIEKEQILTATKSFIYYRTGSEALLRLYDIKKENILETFSLAHQRTIVDLHRTKPGQYWLSIVDFSTDKQVFCKIRIIE